MPSLTLRFLGYVRVEPNGCWTWLGARSGGQGNQLRYGSFRVGDKVMRAHRVAHDIIGRKHCPAGWHRDHTCNNSLCVNPAHIEAVPHEENQRRKVARNK